MELRLDMGYKQRNFSQRPIKEFLEIFQPAPAWTAILVFILLSGLLILVGAGTILNLAFPTGALIIAVFLYFRAPILYFGFLWWICFLSPLVRRLADYRSGFTDPSPILLTPFLLLVENLFHRDMA